MEFRLSDVYDVAGKRFDFVIIGALVLHTVQERRPTSSYKAVTAGLTLASRLSENPGITVAVLEAGKAHFGDPNILAPDGWIQQIMRPEYDWRFPTKPQAGAADISFTWSRGKGLGGSSAMNFLLWTRPHREEIDAIEKLGNPGWDWECMNKYFKRVESFSPPLLNSTKYEDLYVETSMGTEGKLPISFSQTNCGAESLFQQSLMKHGVKIVEDPMSGNSTGTWKAVSTIDSKSGLRSYSVSAYLQTARERPNLKVLAEAHVSRIVSAEGGQNVVATAVEFDVAGEVYRVDVGREVVLSAGQILELSGIGDRMVLEAAGVPVQQHLPSVGTNVQDKVYARVMLETHEESNIVSSNMPKDITFKAKLDQLCPDITYPFSLTMTGLTFLPIQSFIDSSTALIEKQASLIAQNAARYPPGLKEQYEIQLEHLKDPGVPDVEIIVAPFCFTPPSPNKPYIVLSVCTGSPFSRGTIHITSTDPKVPPVIDPCYFEQDIDMDILLESVKFARKVAETMPFKDIVAQEVLPGSDVTSDESIRENVKKNLSTIWHTVGSLSMLPKEKGGVVDHELKVYGTANIRVVDLSVVPISIGAHTQMVAYAIAEKAADIIKQHLN
ncbi:uncharacterized protein FIBRA_07694 [Fibroporia radiculosa]|uniref:Glucose-methanol-choline oxidoreductase N-terminal domain-containing protein n=1 Tax=Fibroporia radiculosa TaxID=599839 RepID=J4GFB2_9APHY|nr:uncharacterized protein FIBRA_07694 [Fibroporia radiculosa]CCM05473.1 predicted protein [Fibroporia radiculosa]